MSRDNLARGLAAGALQGKVIGQSSVAVPNTGSTTENTVATVTIPANSMGANGRIRIEADFSSISGTSGKTLRIKFGATTIYTRSMANTETSDIIDVSIANRNATNSQRYSSRHTNSTPLTQAATGTAAIDTTADVALTFTIQNVTAGDTATLESYQVVLYPKG